MKLLYILHFYQPEFQFKEIMEKIYKESYLPIFNILRESKNAKIVVNINACTLEIFERKGLPELRKQLIELKNLKKIEFTTSTFAHSLIPFLTPLQAQRQVKRNIESLSHLLEIDREDLKVFYPPEFYINQKSLELLKSFNIEFVLTSHNSISGFRENNTKLIQDKTTLLVRSPILSRALESKNNINAKEFWKSLREYKFNNNTQYIALHDAEIIGYSSPEKIEFFKEILNDPNIEYLKLENIINGEKGKEYKKHLKDASWETVHRDNRDISLHWSNKDNEVHKYQWKLTNLIVNKVEELRHNKDVYQKWQTKLDYIQYSCQYWWASSYPFWSPGIVVYAAWEWLRVAYDIENFFIEHSPEKGSLFINKAQRYHTKLIRALGKYDTSTWTTENIKYYDTNIHPLKLTYKA